uniref:ShKT domain-containing protein n=1 Tax=Steinernema glaseri TaxID=37863 RepID=A0A1I7YSY4_9BILA
MFRAASTVTFLLLLHHVTADQVAEIMKFIYDNEKLCGDPFADPQWLPAHKNCVIQCDLYTQMCMAPVVSSFRFQRCTSLPTACSRALRSYLGVVDFSQPERSFEPLRPFSSPAFRGTTDLPNIIANDDRSMENFANPTGLIQMNMFRLARANPMPDSTTRRPIAPSLFRDQKSIFERIRPPASEPEPPQTLSSHDTDYVSYDDNVLNYASTYTEIRTTTSYPTYTSSNDFNDDPYGSQQNQVVFSPAYFSETKTKTPLGRGSLPVDLSREQFPTSGYTAVYSLNEDNKIYNSGSVLPPSPTRNVAPPAPPQPPAVAPPEYEQPILVESQTDEFPSRALSIVENANYDIASSDGLNGIRQNEQSNAFQQIEQSAVRDYSKQCCQWALHGFCDRSWQRIRLLCPKSCGTIICSTADKIQSCSRAIDVEALDCFDPQRSRTPAADSAALSKEQLLNSVPTSAERLLAPATLDEYRRSPERRPSLTMKIRRVEDVHSSPLQHRPANVSDDEGRRQKGQKSQRRVYPSRKTTAPVTPFVIEDEMKKWRYYNKNA